MDKKYNLRLTFNLKESSEFIEFLDVRYRFIETELEIDIYYKETDAHRYLNFNSTHPPHVFRSVVYSQFLRLRITIIDFSLLEFRINEMMNFFKNSDYPNWVLNSIKLDVLTIDRNIAYKQRSNLLNGKFGVGC